ncbi:MAG TPA: lysylphosphatidylglycerol synthase domain-containing protein [Polyangiaceae bacterium]|nr:lysylphosphatidylglycerol synthase domain-containing protein [Polyangiaceae bacterium]
MTDTARPSLWTRFGPTISTLALLGYVGSQIDLKALGVALQQVTWPSFVLLTVTSTIALLLADGIALRQVYSDFVCPVTYRQVVLLRGASYLPQLVNYHVGQAWLAWYAARAYGVGLGRVAGATLLVYATVFGGLFLFGTCAYLLRPNSLEGLGSALLAIGSAAVGYGLLLVWRPRWLTRIPVASVLLEAGVLGNLRALAFRLPHVAVLFLGMWLPFSLFGVKIPLADALLYVPLLMLVGALPFTPQGIGTRDALALRILAPLAPTAAEQAAVAATTLSWAVGMTLVQCIISPWMLAASRRLLATKGILDDERTLNG